ncbi:MAG: transporter substrate-binding protein [Proteobacteria bacterium]|nr:transporter substrate-binding protein [Pseudomonadota bacterium]
MTQATAPSARALWRLLLVACLLAPAWVGAAPPQRIVSLVPGLTESLCALGACARLVGTDRYSNWPSEVQALPKLGGLDDAQVERIAALRPDLVLAAPSARAVQRLEALGLRVIVLHTRSHQDVRHNLLRLGAELGDEARAQQVWRQIEAQMAEAAARVPAALRGRSVYFEVESSPYAAGPTSFIGETLVQLGLNNIVPAALGPFPKLSPEFVVRAQPELVIAEARNLQDMAQRPGWAALRALQRQRLCSFPTERYEVLVRPGPRMGLAALQLADCLAAIGKDQGMDAR